jgi:hypothetical protein
MSIKIKVTDVLEDNVEIINIKALSSLALPEEYLKGYPVCTSHNSVLVIKVNPHTNTMLAVGDVIPRRVFENTYLNWIREAGNRLHRINRRLRKEFTTTYEV